MYLMYNLAQARMKFNEGRNPQLVLKELQIKYISYKNNFSQEYWGFYGCYNIPEGIPKFIKEMDYAPI